MMRRASRLDRLLPRASRSSVRNVRQHVRQCQVAIWHALAVGVSHDLASLAITLRFLSITIMKRGAKPIDKPPSRSTTESAPRSVLHPGANMHPGNGTGGIHGYRKLDPKPPHGEPGKMNRRPDSRLHSTGLATVRPPRCSPAGLSMTQKTKHLGRSTVQRPRLQEPGRPAIASTADAVRRAPRLRRTFRSARTRAGGDTLRTKPGGIRERASPGRSGGPPARSRRDLRPPVPAGSSDRRVAGSRPLFPRREGNVAGRARIQVATRMRPCCSSPRKVKCGSRPATPCPRMACGASIPGVWTPRTDVSSRQQNAGSATSDSS